MAATTERMKAADTWRTEAGLQLLQLAVVHDLKVPVHKVLIDAQVEAELQVLAVTTLGAAAVPEQE